jgi:hypothetical protein
VPDSSRSIARAELPHRRPGDRRREVAREGLECAAHRRSDLVVARPADGLAHPDGPGCKNLPIAGPHELPLGVSGLSAILNFVEGWDGRVLGVRDDAREVDLTLDYRIPEKFGFYQGLWLRVRAAWLSRDISDKNGTDVRVIVRYDFPVL